MSNKIRTGWVYVLVNKSINQQVKIGFTSGHPEDRARELGGSGVPTPYKVATAFLFVDKAYEVEQRVHRLLNDCRVNPNREFFYCDAHAAAHAIMMASKHLGQTPARIAPPLLTPEDIAAKEREEVEKQRREAEQKRIEKEREEAQIEQRKAEEEDRLRKQEQKRQARLKEIEENKTVRSEQRVDFATKIGCFLLIIVVAVALFYGLADVFESSGRIKRTEALRKKIEKDEIENKKKEIVEMISLHEKRKNGTITRQQWDRLIDLRKSMEYKLESTAHGVPYVYYKGKIAKTRTEGIRKPTEKEQAERDEISAALQRVTEPPYSSVDLEMSYDQWRLMRREY